MPTQPFTSQSLQPDAPPQKKKVPVPGEFTGQGAFSRQSLNSLPLEQEGMKELLNWYHKDFSSEGGLELLN